jgi:hypothetical protein
LFQHSFVLSFFNLAFHSYSSRSLNASLEFANAKSRSLNKLTTPSTLHDFGSKETGAIVVASGKDCYNPGGMLDKDKDSYLRCSLEGEDRHITIRFSEDIQVVSFMLINSEQYSSNIKYFEVHIKPNNSFMGV